jgi:hypothetical protein
MPVMKEEWKQGTRGRIPSWISSETGSQVMASSKKAEGFGIQQGPAAFLNEFSNGRNNIVKSGEGNHLKLLHSVTRLKEEENKVESCSSGLNMEEMIRQKRQKWSAASTQGRIALSEVEREARRLRRIQANRESARQTIRRKQVTSCCSKNLELWQQCHESSCQSLVITFNDFFESERKKIEFN